MPKNNIMTIQTNMMSFFGGVKILKYFYFANKHTHWKTYSSELHNGIKEMLESALGFTGRLGEQLFKVGPGNRCFAVAAEGYRQAQDGDSRAEHAGRFFSCIPFHTTTSPFPKTLRTPLFATWPFTTTQHAEQQIAQQSNRRAHCCCVTCRNFPHYKRGMASWRKRSWPWD